MRPREQNSNEQLSAIDSNLFFDGLTRGIIRHPVVGSDGGVYEASSYLQILRNTGMSLVNPALRLSSAVHVPAIQNTIDALFGDNQERPAAYNFQEVLATIQHFNDEVSDDEVDENFYIERIENLEVLRDIRDQLPRLLAQHERFQAAREEAVPFLYALMKLGGAAGVSTAYFSGIMLLLLCVPVIQLLPLLLYSSLFGSGKSLMSDMEVLLEGLAKMLVGGVVGAGVAQLGLFAGRRTAYFPPEGRDEHRFRMD